jgi:hypothetical protein
MTESFETNGDGTPDEDDSGAAPAAEEWEETEASPHEGEEGQELA